MVLAALLSMTKEQQEFIYLKLLILITCSLKDSQNFFIHSLSLHTSCVFSLLLNEDTVDFEKPNGICLLTFVLYEF